MRQVRDSLFIGLILGVVALNAPTSLAQEDILDKRISLNLKDASTQQLFPLFATLLGARLDLHFADEGKISLVFDEITARTSLNALCESAGCGWELLAGDPPTLRFFSLQRVLAEKRTLAEDKRITLDVRAAAAPQVLRLAAKLLGTEVSVDPALAGETITMKLVERTVAEVLDAVCQQLGCRWSLVEGNPARLSVVIGGD